MVVLMVSGSFASVMVIGLKTLSLSMSFVSGPMNLVMLLLFMCVAFFSFGFLRGCFRIASSLEVCGLLDGYVCFLGLCLVLVPVILILISSGVLSILMVQLSLQWFLTMWEARSFVDVLENLQEVQC